MDPSTSRARCAAAACDASSIGAPIWPCGVIKAVQSKLYSSVISVFFLNNHQVYRAKERLDLDFKEQGVDVEAAEEAAKAAGEATKASEGR